jgi:hypothetical protein
MGAIASSVCRAFVNSVVNHYDEAGSLRDIFDRGLFPDLKKFSKMVEPRCGQGSLLQFRALVIDDVPMPTVPPTKSKKQKYNDEQKKAIRTYNEKIQSSGVPHAFGPADLGKSSLIQSAVKAICAKGGMGRFFASTNAFGPIGLGKSSLIQAAMTARLEKLIKDGAIHQRDPLYDAKPLHAFLGDYGDNNRLLSHMFATVFTAATPEAKVAIVKQLQSFDAKLNTYSFRFERKVLNIQRTIAAYTPKVSDERYKAILHTFIAVAAGAGVYYVGTALQPRIVQFFVATAVPQAQNLFHKYGSITVINLCEKISQQTVVLVAYVVNSRVYYWLFGRFYGAIGQMAAYIVLAQLIPPIHVMKIFSFIRASGVFSAIFTGKFVYDSYFSPAAQFQQRLVRSLATTSESPAKEKLLEEGLKAYQVWMYLMTEGAQQGLFKQGSL